MKTEDWLGLIGAFLVTFLWMVVVLSAFGPAPTMPSMERIYLCATVLKEMESSPLDTEATQREIEMVNAHRRAWCGRE